MQKNRIEIAGYLADKPGPARYLPSGTKVVNARAAESHRYRGHNNEVLEQTNWHNLVFFDRLADFAEACEKGDNLYVEGRLQSRKFTPQDGSARTVHEIIVRSCHIVARVQAGQRDQAEPATPPAAATPQEDQADGWSVA